MSARSFLGETLFITFEGPDGSGKTTQLTLLEDHLIEQGYDILRTREPGGTFVGEQIRDVLHNLKNATMSPQAELLLFSASRAQIVAEVIRPALGAGKVVLSDRFFDSTYAYQGYGHGLDLSTLHAITQFATGGLQPDLTVFFQLDTSVALSRKRSSGEWTRMDDYDSDFHHRVSEGYQQLIDAEPERWAILDANQPVADLQNELRHVIVNAIARHSNGAL